MSHNTQPLNIVAQGIEHHFARSNFTLRVDSIEAAAGQTLVLLGPSGSGKSTLLHFMGLLDKPQHGTVLVSGEPATTRDRALRMRMAAVFQRAYLFKGSVGENVEYGLVVRGVPKAQRRAAACRALDKVGLAGYEDRSALALSGGEAQRVSLARALVLEPDVLLLDEPLANLDPLLKRRLTREFAAIVRDLGATVIWVTHDQDEAFVAADSIGIMRDGELVAFGPTDKMMTLPADEWTASFLGLEKPSVGRVNYSRDGLISIAAGDTEIFAVGQAPIGELVSFAVRPEDVIIFASDADIPDSTARNRIIGTVTEIEPRGASTYVTIEAPGLAVAASVSRASVRDLELQEGSEVAAVFKATAVRWD